MRGDVDDRLVGLLRASLGLADVLRDLGVAGEIAVKLPREGGLALLDVITGQSGPDVEAASQRGRGPRAGHNSIAAGGLTFLWPKRLPAMVSANDNLPRPMPGFTFEEETPALR